MRCSITNPRIGFRRYAFVALMVFCSSEVLAQEPKKEIYLDVDPGFTDPVAVEIDGAVTGIVEPRSEQCNSDYDWLAEVVSPGGPCKPSDYETLDPGRLYELTLKWGGNGLTFENVVSFDYYHCTTGDDSFYCAAFDNSGNADVVFHIDASGDLTIRATGEGGLGAASSAENFDEVFGRTDWIWPMSYHESYPHGDGSTFFLTRGSAPYSYPNGNLTIFQDVVIDSSEDWSWSDVTFEIDAGVDLTVHGNLDLDNVTLESSEASPTASTGWGGLSFAPGSSGTITDCTIADVGGYGGASIRIENASPELRLTRIGPPVGYGIDGIKSSGNNAEPILDRNTIVGTTPTSQRGDGIYVSSSSEPRLTGNSMSSNRWGLVAGFATKIFLSPPFGSTRGVPGNTATGNSAGGIAALSGADLTFGYYYYPSGGFHADGYNSASGNTGVGLQAKSTATINAGSLTNFKYNVIHTNTGNNVESNGSASTVYARCNWWGTRTGPTGLSETDGGVISADYYLTDDPFGASPTPSCSSQPPVLPPAMAGAGLDGGQSSNGRQALFAAFEDVAANNLDAALDGLEALILDPNGAYFHSALRLVGSVADREDLAAHVQTRAVGIIETAIESADLETRRAALQSSVILNARLGNSGQVELRAKELLRMADADHELFARLALLHVLVDKGRRGEAMEQLALVEAKWPERFETEMAASVLTDTFGPELNFEGSSSPELSSTKSANDLDNELVSDPGGVDLDGRVLSLSPVFPNPTSGTAVLPIHAGQGGYVRIEVFDMLGRRPVVLPDRVVGEGVSQVEFSAEGMAVGTYFLRAVMTTEDGSIITRVRQFSVR